LLKKVRSSVGKKDERKNNEKGGKRGGERHRNC